jgi:hypothetical protein
MLRMEQTQLAEKSGVSVETIKRLEATNGRLKARRGFCRPARSTCFVRPPTRPSKPIWTITAASGRAGRRSSPQAGKRWPPARSGFSRMTAARRQPQPATVRQPARCTSIAPLAAQVAHELFKLGEKFLHIRELAYAARMLATSDVMPKEPDAALDALATTIVDHCGRSGLDGAQAGLITGQGRAMGRPSTLQYRGPFYS